jgi:carboxypeptidase PM20D1
MLKKIGLAAGIVVFVLAAIVLVRTALFTSKQPAVKPAAKADIDMNGAVERLTKAIRYQTISNQDVEKFDKRPFAEFNAYLEQAFPLVRARLKRETVNGYSLLYTWEGSDPKAKPILLMAHSDVVPVEPGTVKDWKYPPFSGAVTDGFVWGRGTQDIKASLMSALEAFEYLLARGYRPLRTVCLAVGHTEEVRGKDGNGRIAGMLASRGVRFDMVVDEGGFISEGMVAGVKDPVAMVGTAEKGYLSLELSVTGAGGHSSMPPEETPAGILCAAVSRLEKNQYPLRIRSVTRQMLETVGPHMGFGNRLALSNLWLLGGMVGSQMGKTPSAASALRTTIAPTMLQGSQRDNVLPQRVSAVVNFRIFPGDTIAGVTGRARDTIGDARVKMAALPGAREPSLVTDTGLPAYAVFSRTIREVFPGVIVTPFLFVAATDSRFYIPISGSIFRFCPLKYKSEDLERIHGTNERISVENYGDIIRFNIRLIRNADRK